MELEFQEMMRPTLNDYFDRQQELIDDVTEDGESNCCGAKVIWGICMDCREHC